LPGTIDLYDDMGVIGHNPTTGATCFWEDHGDVDNRSDGVFSSLDVSDGDPAKLAALRRVLFGYEGDRCVACHDNDPYMLSPHVSALWRWDLTQYLNGPYAQVRVASEPTPVPHRHLVTQQAAPCRRCHRLSDGRSCKTWIANSTGNPPPERPFQAELLDAGPDLYPFVFWMPHGLPPTRSEWDSQYAGAVAHIRGCCDAPDSPGCVWEALPGYAGP
jgi:hypothetical protein